MSVKKIMCTLATGAMLAFAAPVFADRGDSQVIVQGDNFEPAFARARATGQAFVYRTVWDRRVERYVVEEIPVPYQAPRARGRYRSQPVYNGHPVYQDRSGYRGQPAYHGHPGYAAPAYPAYGEHRDNTAAVLGGAALGAMLGSQVGDHNTRPAAMAVGAVLGAILGSELSDR